MKIERWERETDEEWNKRLAEETTLANNTETTRYFIERDPTDETQFIIHYVGEDGIVWKEHPDGPFNAKQVLEWRNKTEKYDAINWNAIKATLDEKIEAEEKLEAVRAYVAKLRDQAKKTGDAFVRGFCTGIAANFEKILEAEGYPNTEAKQAKPTKISPRPETSNPKKVGES